MRINIERSLLAAKWPEVQPRDCFRNCMLLQAIVGGLYCEGYAAPHNLNIAIEHAWLEVDGEIVDPTWASEQMAANVYVATVKYSADDVSALMDASEDDALHPPLCIRHTDNPGAASKKHHFETFQACLQAIVERDKS